MKKQKMLFASVLLCLMLSISVIAGDTHAVGFDCPPNTQCTEYVDPVTNLLMYFWWIIS